MQEHDAFEPQLESEPTLGFEPETDMDTEVEIEFVGRLEDVTFGWGGPTDDLLYGDYTP